MLLLLLLLLLLLTLLRNVVLWMKLHSVEAVDFMPTLIDIAGISHTVHDLAQLEGTSFMPLLLNPTVPKTQWKSAAFTQVRFSLAYSVPVACNPPC